MKVLRFLHKWIGILLAVFLVIFAVSGIILNHRKTFSGFEINRNYLSEDYHYNNWNNAAVKGSLTISSDSILLYGNIGIWLTDTQLSSFHDFNNGFPKGIDNRKIYSVLHTPKKELLAASHFGLYKYSKETKQWINIALPSKEKRITDLTTKGDSTVVLTRSHVLITQNLKDFEVRSLPKPVDYKNDVSLFQVFWTVHSGKAWGTAGKLVVDFIGILFIFLSVTGIIFFINKYRIKKRVRKKQKVRKLPKVLRWNLKYHNKVGWTVLLFLIVTVITGMFLRPPLLMHIVTKRVQKIPFSQLDNPNPWHDKLRGIRWDENEQYFILSTREGFYFTDSDLIYPLYPFSAEPPVSVMGINVFEQLGAGNYLVGSFNGLYIWNPKHGWIYDYIEKQPYSGMPFSFFSVSGYSSDFSNREIFFDYNMGALDLASRMPFPEMPNKIQAQSGMSLWNLALEVHTGRYYKKLFGKYTSYFIPTIGALTLLMLILGFVVWWKFHKKAMKKSKPTKS